MWKANKNNETTELVPLESELYRLKEKFFKIQSEQYNDVVNSLKICLSFVWIIDPYFSKLSIFCSFNSELTKSLRLYAGSSFIFVEDEEHFKHWLDNTFEIFINNIRYMYLLSEAYKEFDSENLSFFSKAKPTTELELKEQIAKIKKDEFFLFRKGKIKKLVEKCKDSNKRYELAMKKAADAIKSFGFLREYSILPQAIGEIERKIENIKKTNEKIMKEKEEKAKKFQKHEVAYAKAAIMDKKARRNISTLKNIIEPFEFCPYCNSPLNGEEMHLDHIYPVVKGGLSTTENLVYCCKKCNLKKGDKGLIEFLISENSDVQIVVNRLIKMGKKI